MKKNISLLIILCILVISNLVLFAEETKYDFRKANWGMSKEQVKATEDKKPDIDADTALGYSNIMIGGEPFTCVYLFLEDKLYHSGYSPFVTHTNKNLYIDDYENLKETLTKKYGKPKSDKVVWINDLYKDDKQEWGHAISRGDLSYVATWETSTTEIVLTLSGDNYRVVLIIGYDSKELKEWAKEIKEKETSKGL
jgi:hypothetical protein